MSNNAEGKGKPFCSRAKYWLTFPFLLLVISSLIYGEAEAQSRGQETGTQPRARDAGAKSGVKVFEAEPEIQEVTLKLGGQSCDVNAAESAVLRLKGVVMVDVESRKGYLIVGYDPTRVSLDMMLGAVGKKRGKDWFCMATVVGFGRQ